MPKRRLWLRRRAQRRRSERHHDSVCRSDRVNRPNPLRPTCANNRRSGATNPAPVVPARSSSSAAAAGASEPPPPTAHLEDGDLAEASPEVSGLPEIMRPSGTDFWCESQTGDYTTGGLGPDRDTWEPLKISLSGLHRTSPTFSLPPHPNHRGKHRFSAQNFT